jgi:hypothetical protein
VSKLDCILIYGQNAWKGFLISHLAADYCHVEAGYDDDPGHLERFLTPNIRAVLFQINLSHSALFPERRSEIIRRLQERGVPLLNGEVDDIRKRTLHHLLARAGLRSARADEAGPPDERLFVKSNLNWGGDPERRLPPDLRQRIFPEPLCPIRTWHDYYVTTRRDIAPALWSNTSVVIERFIENPENSFFRIYGFGDSIVVVKAHSPFLIKKVVGEPHDRNIFLQREQVLAQTTNLRPDLEEIVAGFVRRYPLAYFCLDVVHDGRTHYVIDLNLTPYAGIESQDSDVVEFLSQGAITFLKRPSRWRIEAAP